MTASTSNWKLWVSTIIVGITGYFYWNQDSTVEPSVEQPLLVVSSPAERKTEPPQVNKTPGTTNRLVLARQEYESVYGGEAPEENLALEAYSDPTADSIGLGQKVFETNCASCHGVTGSGDGSAGSTLDPKPTNLQETKIYKYGFREMAVYRTAAYGIDGTGMTPWVDILEPKELWAVAHYIRSIQVKPEPEARTEL